MTSVASIPFLPENAPFAPAQRAWLNGFFAGLMSPAAGGPADQPASPPPAATVVEEEAFPWHDPALPMDERLKLAEGKPRARLMMAAMAQLDCGSCGYDCRTYAEAIDRGEDKDLTKCSPGGTDTARKLKELIQLKISAPAPAAPAKPAAPAASVAVAPRAPASAGEFSRFNPFPAVLLANRQLNRPGSAKDTRHVVFSLKGSGLTYEPGDALGVYPENSTEMIDRVLIALGATGAEEVPDHENRSKTVSFYEALSRQYSLTPTPALLELLAKEATNPAEADSLRKLIESDEAPGGMDVADLLERHPSARPTPIAFTDTLPALRPRLYSISSSLRAHPDEVHLTVGVVRYVSASGRTYNGVASTCMAERVRPGQRLRVYVHRTPHFRLPGDPGTPVIMIGPGTGIAPFRAFLEERRATGASGRNWLFFGDQHAATDFLYEDETNGYLRDGVLTRLDTAFSRDGASKTYVQHRMLEHGRELWAWLQDGAHFYVCGDAQRMAADVDRALRQIVREHGGLSSDDADAYVSDLSRAKRYQRDVY